MAEPNSAAPVEAYEFGPFRIELSRRQLLRNNQPVMLPLKAFDTLVLLVKYRDRVVGKDELLSSVWSDSFVTEDSLTQNISALRRALGDDPSQPKFIATVARRGYHFIAPVIALQAELPPVSATATPPSHESGDSRRGGSRHRCRANRVLRFVLADRGLARWA